MKRELIVTADGRDRTVVVDGPLPDGRFRVTIDGQTREVDATPIRPGTWSLLLAGASFVVDLDKRRNGVAASVGASEAMLQVEDALHRRLASAASPRGERRQGRQGVGRGRRYGRARLAGHRARGDEDGERAGVRARRNGRAGRQAGRTGRRYRRPAGRADLTRPGHARPARTRSSGPDTLTSRSRAASSCHWRLEEPPKPATRLGLATDFDASRLAWLPVPATRPACDTGRTQPCRTFSAIRA